MNIALVILNADPQRGGAERYTADIARALVRRGHRVDLIATKFGSPIDGANFVPIAVKSPSRAGRYLQFLDRLDEHLVKEKYDIVHSMLPVRHCDLYHPHAGMAKAALETHLSRESGPARVMAKLANRLNRKRQSYARVEDELIHGVDKPMVVSLSDYVSGMILRNYAHISGQLVKLFNGTDLGKFDPAAHAGGRDTVRKQFGIPRDAVVALMIAQHFERKGLAEVIAAVAKMGEKAPVVLVVGKDDPARMQVVAKKLGVEEKIIFAGQTSSSADFYAASDFFVLPTRHDSCSLVVLEALAMAVPVISTVFNGACEIMREGEHGFVLEDPGNVDGLAGAMGKLLDRELRERMRAECLELRGVLSFEAHMDRVEELYRMRIKSRAHTAGQPPR
jgi:UDP-glucose:(heptosyl)LPS alpha-1,3-glucosyltransferase